MHVTLHPLAVRYVPEAEELTLELYGERGWSSESTRWVMMLASYAMCRGVGRRCLEQSSDFAFS
jgi:hypothetical protein